MNDDEIILVFDNNMVNYVLDFVDWNKFYMNYSHLYKVLQHKVEEIYNWKD